MFEIPAPSTKYVASTASQRTIIVPSTKRNDQNTLAGLKVGQKVRHQTYGEGMILNISNGNADVVFATAGKKVLNLKYAPLTPVD